MPTFSDDQWLAVAAEHERAGQFAEAGTIYRQLAPKYPHHPALLHAAGVAAQRCGQLHEAVQWIRKAIALDPGNATYFNNLGAALHSLGAYEDALAAYEEAIRLAPALVLIEYNLGYTKRQLGRWDAAAGHFRRLLAHQPDHAEAHINLGFVLLQQGLVDEAIAAGRAAVERLPDHVRLWNNLGNALTLRSDWTGAVAAYREALKRSPADALAWNNFGDALTELGLAGEAVACFRRSLESQPSLVDAHSNLIFNMNLLPETTPEAMAQECRQWWERHGAPRRAGSRPALQRPDPERRLRVGFVSPDFREHPVGRHLLPVLRALDPKQLEVVIYSDASPNDAMTAQFRVEAARWHDSSLWPDERLAAQIREDGVDILVDLALHSAGNRLLVFARQPAPVQASFAGYPGSTGLETIDYRLTDRFLDPPDEAGTFRDEPIRLPDSFWCFDPLGDTPPVNELPAPACGTVTFGCLSKFSKTNSLLFDWWGEILRRVPGSQLLLLCPVSEARSRVSSHFRAKGLEDGRVIFTDRLPRSEYLALHHRIDITLDPFPYNGHMTTCDALWMGVPVVTLAGKLPVSRGGLSLLSNIGLPELIALSADEYVRIAVELAGDLPRLASLRAGLRERMQASPLMDPVRFARGLESACRSMWRRCLRRTLVTAPE